MIGILEVEHVAKLARLHLSDGEMQLYATQLAKVIDNFDQLKALDTDGVQPMAHALSLTGVLRLDQVVADPGTQSLLAEAPAIENGLFRVPRIGD